MIRVIDPEETPAVDFRDNRNKRIKDAWSWASYWDDRAAEIIEEEMVLVDCPIRWTPAKVKTLLERIRRQLSLSTEEKIEIFADQFLISKSTIRNQFYNLD